MLHLHRADFLEFHPSIPFFSFLARLSSRKPVQDFRFTGKPGVYEVMRSDGLKETVNQEAMESIASSTGQGMHVTTENLALLEGEEWFVDSKVGPVRRITRVDQTSERIYVFHGQVVRTQVGDVMWDNTTVFLAMYADLADDFRTEVAVSLPLACVVVSDEVSIP